MGLLLRSLPMLLVILGCFLRLPGLWAQEEMSSARTLDALLQDYAYRAFVRPRTGVQYDGFVPSNLTGIRIAAMRLRSGSLRTRGVKMYNEFVIPTGVTEMPYVERLVLVYQNLGNWSVTYYPLPGYTYLTPVLGLLAYSAANLSATNLLELDIRTSGDPISIKFPDVRSVPDGSAAKCVWFDLSGLPSFSNVVSSNVCTTTQQGHFSIVVESITPSPAPTSPTPPSGGTPNVGPAPGEGGKKKNSNVGIIVGSVVGGLVLLVLLSLLVLWMHKLKQRKKMQKLERAAEVGEALQMTSVGGARAPAATATRTQPALENEYVP